MPGRIKIVAIIDDPALAEEIRVELLAGSDLTLVTQVQAALAHLQANPEIDLVILPEVADGGTAVARAAELRSARADLPVLVLARVPESRDLLAALRGKQITDAVQTPWRKGELLAATERIREMSHLRRELESTRRQMHRRVESMSAMSELTAAIVEAGSYDHLVRVVAGNLFRISPMGMGAAMITVDDRAYLHLHCQQPYGRDSLRMVRDRCLDTFRSLTARTIEEEKLEVDVSGERLGLESNHEIKGVLTHVPIHLDTKIIGLLMLGTGTGVTPVEEKRMYFVAKRAAEAYRRLSLQRDGERRRLALVLEPMADGVIITDAHSDHVLINPAAQQMLGLVGEPMVALGRIQDKLGFSPKERITSRSKSSAEPVREEIRVNERALQSIVSPVHDRNGKLTSVVVVLRDITEAKELARRQNDFISLISHELRTPLTQIAGVLDIVLNGHAGRITDRQKFYLDAARDSYSRLNALIENLLDAARAERDTMLGQVTLVTLDELSQEVVERYRGEAEAKSIRLTIRSDDKRIRLLGDPDRLTQVLNNLLSNAIRFTPQGGEIEVRVFVSSVLADHVGVSIYNSGEPIPQDALERIFAKFEQLEDTSTRQVEGAGLGLPISRAIIKAHQGYIWAVPLETGTRFEFILPVTPTTEEHDDERLAEDEGSQSAQRRQGPVSNTDAVVLIVDERHSSYMLQGILKSAGYKVNLVQDADGALSSARAEPPNLAVINIAETDGQCADLIEIFAHDPDTRKTAILVVSASENAREAAMQANADEFLLMPVQQDQFLATCTRLIQDAGRPGVGRVLVVDDDATIRMICRDALERRGYEVHDVGDGASALEAARRFRPDVTLLDIMMPRMDGFQTAEKFRADPATSMTPIIFVSAKGETRDKVRAFLAGAEDYMVKPLNTRELVARVDKCLKRQARELGASPTTQLPGADAIEAEIERRLALAGDDAFCYLDLDNLKAFNDYYGYAKADGIIRQIGDIIRDVIAREGRPGDFIGHIAGDDFVFITSSDRVDKVCKTICSTFDRLVPLYYNKADRERGFIETEDRYGIMRRFPIMTVSVAGVTLSNNDLKSFSDLAAAAAQGKKLAKELQGSSYVLDGQPILGVLPSQS